MSEVYVRRPAVPGRPRARLEFIADANADIVRGADRDSGAGPSPGQRTADILAFDVEAFFRRIGLEPVHYVPRRRNGLAGMIQRNPRGWHNSCRRFPGNHDRRRNLVRP